MPKAAKAKTREDVIKALKAQIAADPKGSKEPLIGAGTRTFSIEDLLKEIENNTDLGKKLLESWLKLSQKA
jgi:hypothetical protein